jgi:glycosyltransferase involved in cell wall biosynthesis
MNFPKISIVIPSYNQGQFLEETILSVINQQYPNLELFVVDGGSNDNSADIIKKYQPHISWWVSEKDKGQSDAINKGFARAKGEIISWLCSDDLLTQDALKVVSGHFSSADEKIGLLHGGAVIFKAGKIKGTRFSYQVPNREAYLSGIVFPQPAAFFRRSFLDKVGFLNESFHYGMDYDLFLRLSLICDFLPINEVLARYRLHEKSKSIAQSHYFINDWKRSFVNLCKNLEWSKELKYLERTTLFTNEISFYEAYSFKPDNSIKSGINKNKSLFFHLGHILKDLYWTNQLEQARILKNMMKADFDTNWWKEDPRLNTIAAKLSYPAFALNLLKSIKSFVGAR